MSKIIQLTIKSTASLETTGSAIVVVNLSISHLKAAALFSRHTGTIESENIENKLGEFWEEIQSNAIATIMTSVAAIEAYINEIFVDYSIFFPNTNSVIWRELWNVFEKKRVLEKYELALRLRNNSEFRRGQNKFQNVQSLIELRNNLVHYKPDISDGGEVHGKVSKKLQGKAKLSPFFEENAPLFPQAWASHETTKWAVKAVTDFILEFETLAQIDSRLAPFLEQVTT